MTKLKRNFKSKLHLACSKDALRPALQRIHFLNGFAYATEGYIMIKQHLTLHEFNDDEIKFLEGKSIHRCTFAEILKYDIISIKKDVIVCTKNSITCNFSFIENDYKAPSFESILPDMIKVDKAIVSMIGVDLKMLNIFNDLLIFDGDKKIKMNFSAHNKGIIITALNGPDIDEQIGMIMPVMLNEDL